MSSDWKNVRDLEKWSAWFLEGKNHVSPYMKLVTPSCTLGEEMLRFWERYLRVT